MSVSKEPCIVSTKDAYLQFDPANYCLAAGFTQLYCSFCMDDVVVLTTKNEREDNREMLQNSNGG